MKKIVLGLLGLLCFSGPFVVSAEGGAHRVPSHFIVLFDASGSMKKMEPVTWQIVKKALYASPSEFPRFTEHDYFSFLFFSLDWSHPSYRLEDMFLTNKDLRLVKGFPRSPEPFGREVYPRKPFSGHSPLIAATTVALPYLGTQVRSVQGEIGKTIIVRVTDGQYNTLSNGADEFRAIRQTTQDKKLSPPTGFDEYLAQAARVNAVFDLNYRSEECALPVKEVNASTALLCGPRAYKATQKAGDALAISYFEVVPRHPPLETLAGMETENVTLDREARDGQVYYVGKNTLRVAGWQNKEGSLHVSPHKVQWRLPGPRVNRDWSDCALEKQKRIAGGDWKAACQNGDEIRFEKTGEGPFTAHYRFTFTSSTPLYPFTYLLERPTQVSLYPGKLGEYYPDISGDIRGAWRYFFPQVPEPQSITDSVLLEEAKRSPGSTVTLSDVVNASQQRYVKYQQAKAVAGMRLGGMALFFLAFWLLWPFRRLAVFNVADRRSEVMVDFNQLPPPTMLIGMIAVEKVKRRFWVGILNNWPFRLRLKIPRETVKFETDRTILDPDQDIRWAEQALPLWVANSEEIDYVDRHASSGQRYPVLFGAGRLQDYLKADTPVGGKRVLDISFKVEVPTVKQDLQQGFRVHLIPEVERFYFDAQVLAEQTTEDRQLRAFYKHNKYEKLLRYRLENRTRHEFSRPAHGQWSLEVRRADGTRVNDAFFLVGNDITPTSSLNYQILHGQPLELDVEVDYTRLENPFQPQTYQLTLLNDGIPRDNWTFLLERSIERTDVYMEVLDARRRPFLYLEEGVREGMITLSAEEIHTEGSRALNFTTLLYLRLVNRCPGGHGYAEWSLELGARGQGGDFPPPAFEWRSQGAKRSPYGRLSDSADPQEREIELVLVLRHSRMKIYQRDMTLSLELRVNWKKWPDGPKGEEIPLPMTARVVLPLRHIPERHILAIDFGTSAIAMAHAVLEDMEMLPLPERLRELDKARGADVRASQVRELGTPFLSSDANLNLMDHQPRHPDRPDYLNLPAFKEMLITHPDAVFMSLKMLIAAGHKHLLLNPQRYPWLHPDGQRETQEPPLLEEVLKGVYRGLNEDYIGPILRSQAKDFPYLVITHPNTYAWTHRDMLRRIVQFVFVGGSGTGMLYQENIHLISESDAVAYYYLAHAGELRQGSWGQLPQQETIFIYDIGAGTLDMTLLRVERRHTPDGVLVPSRIEILNRAGVNKAGNLLDECIARDLDRWLVEKLPEYYVNHIVKAEGTDLAPGSPEYEAILLTMLLLHEQIEALKKAWAAAKPPAIILAGPVYGLQGGLVKTDPDAMDQYRKTDGLEILEHGSVGWQLDRDEVLKGPYVQAFIDEVTRKEVLSFIGDDSPAIDTVILSGRTSLWPGFEDSLKQTLPKTMHWIDFSKDATLLKQVVVEGAVISQTRWRDQITIEDPGVFGQYGVEYERRGKGDWHFQPVKSGETVTLHLDNALVCRVGLRTRNGFIRSFEFPVSRYCPGPKKTLELTLEYSEQSQIRVKVRGPDGREDDSLGYQDIALLQDRRLVSWPLSRPQLDALEPEKVVE